MRFFSDEIVENLAVRALDLEAHARPEGVLFHFLQQATAAETPHLTPPHLACNVNGRWEGGHRCVSEKEKSYEMRNLLPSSDKVKSNHRESA
jgi:hypothetical protein